VCGYARLFQGHGHRPCPCSFDAGIFQCRSRHPPRYDVPGAATRGNATIQLPVRPMSDGYFSDVVVMLDELTAEQTNAVVERLKAAGLDVSRVDDDLSVVEGTIEASRTHDLQKIECVRYVRSVFTYLADYPPGDPRDRDGQ
jgi:hypothetical protein